jgi:hypothetical protein
MALVALVFFGLKVYHGVKGMYIIQARQVE